MSQPLFYRSVVPLHRETHRGLGLAAVPSFAFAAASHLIPAVVDEFSAACAELPILFAPDVEGASPAFLTGLTPGCNAFVRADGSWAASYVPAYLRRYPFILGEVPNAEPLVCLDDHAACLGAGGADMSRCSRPMAATPPGLWSASGSSPTTRQRPSARRRRAGCSPT